MSSRELARLLGVNTTAGRNVTVAGLIQSINRRFPRMGDVCLWHGHALQVVAELDKGKVEIEVTKPKNDEAQS
ncbi:MAG: hypothetical protein R3C05_30870 [Pirellulaceae bacterium]